MLRTSLLLSLAASASATIYTTSPTASTTCTGGTACLIKWEDGGAAPAIDDFGMTSVGLFTGNSQQQTLLVDFGMVDPSQNTTMSPVIAASVGPNSNLYFIRFTSADAKDPASNQPLQAFSARFTMAGMTGTFSAEANAQNAAIPGAAQNPIPIVANATSASASATPAPSASSSSKAPAFSTVSRNVTNTTGGAAVVLPGVSVGAALGAVGIAAALLA